MGSGREQGEGRKWMPERTGRVWPSGGPVWARYLQEKDRTPR